MMLAVGSQSPDYRLKNLDGEPKSLRGLAAQESVAEGPVLIAFYKAACPVCQLTLPFLERLKNNGRIRVVAVSQDDAATARQFNKAFSVTLETLLDEKQQGYAASNGFGISQVPSLFQLEPNGTVSHAWEGFSKADMEALGQRAGAEVFRAGERPPLMRPG